MLVDTAKVISNRKIANDIYQLDLKLNCLVLFKAGQFIQIHIEGKSGMFLPRPFSIYVIKENIVSIIYKVVGSATNEIARLREDDRVKIWGPLGNSFTIKDNKKRCLIAGGIGIVPILALMEEIKKAKLQGENDIFIGAKNRDEIIGVNELKVNANNVFIATDDGSLGYKGFITDKVLKEICNYDILYVCGPRPMEEIIAVASLKMNIPCEISMEEYMACGLGICVGCVAPVKQKDGFVYKRLCKDGPIMEANMIDWDEIKC